MRAPFLQGGHAALAFALLVLSLAADAQATRHKAPAHSPPHATRLVAEFSEKESALAKAIANGDKAAALSLVDPNFELVASTNLDQSIPFEAWAAEAARTPRRSPRPPRDLSVRDMDGVALVCFYWDDKVESTKVANTWMVLDAWRLGADGWKLRTRFVSPRGNPKINPPGYRPDDSLINKRY